MKFPHIKQHDEKDCGAACLAMISEYYGLKLKISKFRDLIKVDNMGANIYGIVTGANEIGFDTEALEGSYTELIDGINSEEIKLPLIARIINESGYEHFVVVYLIKKNYILIGDPGKNSIKKMPVKIFKEQWQEQIIVLNPNKNFKKKNEKKGSFRKFFKYITNQKKILVFVFVMSIIITLINVSSSLIFQYVISDVQGVDVLEDDTIVQDYHHQENHESENKNTFARTLKKIEDKLTIVFLNLNTVCITIILLYLLRIFIQIFRGYLLSKTARLVDVPLTLDYYNHLMDLPAGFYGTRKTGEYMSRFNDTDRIRNAISSTTLTLMLDSIMAIGCSILLCSISVKLFLITLSVVIVYAFIMFTFRKPIKSINLEIMEDKAQITSYLKESIDGMETIKTYHYESESKYKLRNLYKCFANKVLYGSVLYNIQESLVGACASIGIVVLLWVGASLCVNNVITLSDLLIFYYLISYFLNPVQNLINLQPEIQTAMVAAERLNDILDVEKENNNRPSPKTLKGDIVLNNVDFRYGNRELVLNKLNMTFKNGKKTAIIGESGCGKTTIAKLLVSFYKPEEGEITIGGDSIFNYSPNALREKISYISQNVFLFSDTIYNNLRMGNESITDEEIESVCKSCFADEFINKLPMKYMTVIEENGNNLSGGQKQRLAIARALLRSPDILIMDESTSNLDVITEENIYRIISKLSKKITVIIIAHRLRTVRSCDYIYVLNNGSVQEQGTHDKLIGLNGMYSDYWNSQI